MRWSLITMSIRSHELLLPFFLITFVTLFATSNCARTIMPLSSPEGVMMEDKIRLGSTPPSCHNRCNACNPCTAVQVPSLSGPGNRLVQTSTNTEMPFSMYSNYKPLGWKCRCGDQLFNP